MDKIQEITRQIIAGYRIKKGEDTDFLIDGDLSWLQAGADAIKRAFCGNHVDLCTIINGRSGRCSEDCRFCAQSAHYPSSISSYPFLDPEIIVKEGKEAAAKGVHRYSIVTAGRTLDGLDLNRACTAYRMLKQSGSIKLCGSHGLLSAKALEQLKESGVERIHQNLETSRRNFPNICTTHTYDDKIATIRLAKEIGLQVCSGGIMGMGETWQDRIDMALDLQELQVDSIPLNFLHPIPGTPFADLPVLSEKEMLRCIILFRYLNPTADIRLAAGRDRMAQSGRDGFCSGANAAITGDMLTTTGNNTKQDIDMLTGMGFDLL